MTRPAIARPRPSTDPVAEPGGQPTIYFQRGNSGERGFALILVIWGLGLISLITLTVVTVERFRIKAVANLLDNARAEALGEGGVNLVRLQLIQGLSSASPNVLWVNANREPRVCAMPDGSLAAIAAEEESGKIDLNAASPKLLSALLRGFGANFDESDRLATVIVDFSHAGASSAVDHAQSDTSAQNGQKYPPKKGPFETVFELDQIIGMRQDLFRRILSYVTVYSHAPGIDPGKAAPALLAALGGKGQDLIAEIEVK